MIRQLKKPDLAVERAISCGSFTPRERSTLITTMPKARLASISMVL